jgi:hypothetical protein
MSLAKIISIPGMSGLYKMVAQMRNGGFVVESLQDKKRFPVSSTQRIVMLEDISVYTMEEDMPLKEVFLKMKEQDEVCAKMNAKSDPAELKSTLKKVVPEFDEERVHASDIKKMFAWYGLLREIIGTEPEEEEEQSKGKEVKAKAETKAKAEAKPKVKAGETAVDEPEAKPKKVKAAKAKATNEEGDATAAKKTKAPRKTTKKDS